MLGSDTPARPPTPSGDVSHGEHLPHRTPKNLASTRWVNPNDPLAGALPDSSSYWGEGTRYVIGLGLKEWSDAVCNPAAEPTSSLDTVGGARSIPDCPGRAPATPKCSATSRRCIDAGVMAPRRAYPATVYTESDFWWGFRRLGRDRADRSSSTSCGPRPIAWSSGVSRG